MKIELQKAKEFLDKYPEFGNYKELYPVKNAVDNICTSDSIKKQIEQEFNSKIIINSLNNEISLISNNGIEIGSISVGTYQDGLIFFDSHLVFEILETYRGLGLGQKLLNLYKIKFGLPKEEYTNVPSMVNLYKKNGYEVKGKLVSGMNVFTELSEKDKEIIETILSNTKQGIKEEKLNFTVILEKDS